MGDNNPVSDDRQCLGGITLCRSGLITRPKYNLSSIKVEETQVFKVLTRNTKPFLPTSAPLTSRYLWIICEMESQFKQHASSGERSNLGLKYEATWSNFTDPWRHYLCRWLSKHSLSFRLFPFALRRSHFLTLRESRQLVSYQCFIAWSQVKISWEGSCQNLPSFGDRSVSIIQELMRQKYAK